MLLSEAGKCVECGHHGSILRKAPSGAREWLCGDCDWDRSQAAPPAPPELLADLEWWREHTDARLTLVG